MWTHDPPPPPPPNPQIQSRTTTRPLFLIRSVEFQEPVNGIFYLSLFFPFFSHPQVIWLNLTDFFSYILVNRNFCEIIFSHFLHFLILLGGRWSMRWIASFLLKTNPKAVIKLLLSSLLRRDSIDTKRQSHCFLLTLQLLTPYCQWFILLNQHEATYNHLMIYTLVKYHSSVLKDLKVSLHWLLFFEWRSLSFFSTFAEREGSYQDLCLTINLYEFSTKT